MIQNKTFRNDINIEIDPVIINTQIEEIKELNEDFYKEYSEIYNEYTGLIIKLDESSNDLTDFINNQILQNLEKSLDICELSIKILQHKSHDTYISVANIIKNYNLKIPGNENETLCENDIFFKLNKIYYLLKPLKVTYNKSPDNNEVKLMWESPKNASRIDIYKLDLKGNVKESYAVRNKNEWIGTLSEGNNKFSLKYITHQSEQSEFTFVEVKK